MEQMRLLLCGSQISIGCDKSIVPHIKCGKCAPNTNIHNNLNGWQPDNIVEAVEIKARLQKLSVMLVAFAPKR